MSGKIRLDWMEWICLVVFTAAAIADLARGHYSGALLESLVVYLAIRLGRAEAKLKDRQ